MSAKFNENWMGGAKNIMAFSCSIPYGMTQCKTTHIDEILKFIYIYIYMFYMYLL